MFSFDVLDNIGIAMRSECAICQQKIGTIGAGADEWNDYIGDMLHFYNQNTNIPMPIFVYQNAQDAPFDHIICLATRADMKELGEEREHLFQEASDLLSKSMGSDANDLPRLFSQAEILLLKGDPDQALAVLRTLTDLNKQGEEKARMVTGKMDRIRELRLAGRNNEAAQLLEETEGYRKTLNVARVSQHAMDLEVQLLLAQAYEAKPN